MKILQQLEIYINAQKNVAIQFIIIGVGLLLLFALLHFFSESAWLHGLKIGALICGCFILVGGVAYYNTENKLLKSSIQLYQNNTTDFQKTELERMQKVIRDYPIYQIIFSSLIVLSLLGIWLLPNPFWQGVACATVLLFVAVILVEAYSYQSIKAYVEFLKK